MKWAIIVCAGMSVVLITIAYRASKPSGQYVIQGYSVPKPIVAPDTVAQGSVVEPPIPEEPSTNDFIIEDSLVQDTVASPEHAQESVEELLARTEHLSSKEILKLNEQGTLTTSQTSEIMLHRSKRAIEHAENLQQEILLYKYKTQVKKLLREEVMDKFEELFGHARPGDPEYPIVEREFQHLKRLYRGIDTSESTEEIEKLVSEFASNLHDRFETIKREMGQAKKRTNQ